MTDIHTPIICHDMETENKISVVINTYNAARYLQKALEAAKEFDEIVVCDMESTDDTCEIARRYGCKIVTFPKNGITIVEPARNFAIQSATHKWVLVVDADEIITDELSAYLNANNISTRPYNAFYDYVSALLKTCRTLKSIRSSQSKS